MNRDLKDIIKLSLFVITCGVITHSIPDIDLNIKPKYVSEINIATSLEVDRSRVDAVRDIRTNADIVYYYLIDNGYSKEQTCAIMGNIAQESEFNEKAVESNGIGYGLIQWSFDRRTQLENTYNDPSNIYNQLDFLNKEMSTQFTQYYKEIFDNSNNLEELTIAFCTGFERAGIPHMDNRIAMAKYYYNLYQ